MSPSDASFSADALDHHFQPTSPSAAERRGLALALLVAAALHLLIPLAFFLSHLFSPAPAPPVQEIPVEVVIEPPPPPKPQEKPQPPPQPEDERPAYDAPSAATPEKANRESPRDKTTAPAPKAEPSPIAGAPQESHQPQAAAERKAEPPPPETPAPDAERPAAPSPSPAEADAAPPAANVASKPAPPPAPPAKAPPGVPPPAADTLPQYEFARAATESPVVGGNADSRYLTIVYGMIRSHLRRPTNPTPPIRSGRIVFMVDEAGNLVERKVVNSSGSPNLDMAMMTAVAEAAPYPAPPGWQAKSMSLVYGR